MQNACSAPDFGKWEKIIYWYSLPKGKIIHYNLSFPVWKSHLVNVYSEYDSKVCIVWGSFYYLVINTQWPVGIISLKPRIVFNSFFEEFEISMKIEKIKNKLIKLDFSHKNQKWFLQIDYFEMKQLQIPLYSNKNQKHDDLL